MNVKKMLMNMILFKTLPIKYNKTQLVEKCKPFIASSILFLLLSLTIIGIFIYFYINSHSKMKLKKYYQTYHY